MILGKHRPVRRRAEQIERSRKAFRNGFDLAGRSATPWIARAMGTPRIVHAGLDENPKARQGSRIKAQAFHVSGERAQNERQGAISD